MDKKPELCKSDSYIEGTDAKFEGTQVFCRQQQNFDCNNRYLVIMKKYKEGYWFFIKIC